MAAAEVKVPSAGDQELATAYRRLQAAYQQSLRYAEDVRRLYTALQRGLCQSLLGLANALEAKDRYTRGHSDRVSRWSHQLAKALGLDGRHVETITQAGLLHDIGKIGVPESVLRKPGRLDASDWIDMQRHPLIGAQIVSPFDFFAGGVLVIRHHHERWDGSGYPDGLRRSAIPLGARIVAVADVFDAMTSDRAYRPALSPEAALGVLREQAGLTLDPDVVAGFLELVQDDAADA